MILFAVRGTDREDGKKCLEFINWHADESDEVRSTSHLRIVALNFGISETDA